jgi:putative transcriptional regulator
MKKKAKYRSKVAEAVHAEYASREFDVRTLAKIEDLSTKQIQALRERAGVSQSVFARVLNVTTNHVSQLERGAKRSGSLHSNRYG